MNILKSLSVALIFTLSLILFTPSTTALATEVKQTEAQQLSVKIKQAVPNSKIATVDNNGKLIDLKKDNEGKVYATEHNSSTPLIDSDEFHINSCNFWVQAAVFTVGIVVFFALALAGTTALLEFMVITLGFTFIYYDAVLLAGGILAGWSILQLGEWIAGIVCGVPKQEPPKKDICHWCGVPD